MSTAVHYEPIGDDQGDRELDAPGPRNDLPDEISENTRFRNSSSASSVSELDTQEHHMPSKGVDSPTYPDDILDLDTKPPWQDPVRWCMWGNIAVLIINIIFTAAAVGVSASKHYNHGFGSTTIYKGSCKTAKYTKIGLHLLINVLSVTMTATSSYCCTILMAPSRTDVDKAHAQGTWLSLGVSSYRNFRNMRRSSQVLWGLLLFTSMIMQMVYNSVIYSSLNANTYPAIVVPSDFVSNASVPTSYYEDRNCFTEKRLNWTISDLRTDILNGDFEYLSKEDCVNAYVTSYVSDRRSVILVTKKQWPGTGIFLVGYGYPGGIAELDPSRNNSPMSFDIFSGGQLDKSNVGFEWACTLDHSQTGDCSNSNINGQSVWNVTGLEWSKLTSVSLENVNTDGAAIPPIDRLSTWFVEGTERLESQLNETVIKWNMDEIKDFVHYVYENPTEEQMWTYLNHTSWKKSVYDYTSGGQVYEGHGKFRPEARGHINVSTYCPAESQMWDADSQVTVDYCLSQRSNGACGLFYNVPIAFTIIICGLVKVICMWLLLRTNRLELLLTIGDAISSFLQRPDLTTKFWCTLSSDMVSSKKECPWNSENKSFERTELLQQEPHPDFLQTRYKPWTDKRAAVVPNPKMWKQATSVRMWVMTWFAMISYIVISVLFPALATMNSSTQSPDGAYSSKPLEKMWQIQGWGEVQSIALLTSYVASFVGSVLVSNIPQLAASFLYYCLNDHLTRCLLAADYNSFAIRRRPLRVSFPQGEQRSTLYLTIPYEYAIPLLAGFTLIHWFISEGLFYVQVLPYGIDSKPVPSKALVTCGVSTIPLITALGVALAIFFAIVLLGFRETKDSKMPVAHGMSVVVSAACHPPYDDFDAAYKPVKWGVVAHCPDAAFPHCSFTSQEVTEPDVDVKYA